MTSEEDVLAAIADEGLREQVREGWGVKHFRPMDGDDPAQALVMGGGFTVPTIYRSTCYICKDPEFATMGMTLCSVCPSCQGHVPGDDSVCDDCGYDLMDGDYEAAVPVEAQFEIDPGTDPVEDGYGFRS